MSITDAEVIQEAARKGIGLSSLGTGTDHDRSWYVTGVGAIAILSWSSDAGYTYRAKFGRRWKTRARHKTLARVLTEIELDVQREKSWSSRYTVPS